MIGIYPKPIFLGPHVPEGRSAQHGPHGIVDGQLIYCWQKKWEFERALELYVARKPKKVLELGTAGGGSLYWWLQKATPGTTIVSVDTYSPERGWYGEKDNRHQYHKWTPEGVELLAVEGDTQDNGTVLEVMQYGPYDWIFIDAGHAYDEMSFDWRHYGNAMVAKGGLVMLQDIYHVQDGPSVNDAERLWGEIRHLGHLTQELLAVTGNEAWGIGIVYF